MKTRGTKEERKAAQRDALRQIKSYSKQPWKSSDPFSYAAQAETVREAKRMRDLMRSIRDADALDDETRHLVIARYKEALDAAWDPELVAAYEAIEQKKEWNVAPVIRFLEADPRFFRSGYAREYLIRRLIRQVLTSDQEERLQKIVLKKVANPDIREFRHYGRLARRVDSPELRAAIRVQAENDDWDIRRRARWMLEALGELPTANQILNGMKQQERQQQNAERKGIADAGKREH